MFGEKALYEGGLSVRTTLDPKLQVLARQALMNGLVKFDQARGWRGPVKHFDEIGDDWGVTVAEVEALADVVEWRLPSSSNRRRRIHVGLQPGPSRAPTGARRSATTGVIPPSG